MSQKRYDQSNEKWKMENVARIRDDFLFSLCALSLPGIYLRALLDFAIVTSFIFIWDDGNFGEHTQNVNWLIGSATDDGIHHITHLNWSHRQECVFRWLDKLCGYDDTQTHTCEIGFSFFFLSRPISIYTNAEKSTDYKLSHICLGGRIQISPPFDKQLPIALFANKRKE